MRLRKKNQKEQFPILHERAKTDAAEFSIIEFTQILCRLTRMCELRAHNSETGLTGVSRRRV